MRSLLVEKAALVRRKMGDFWWYSLLIMAAHRTTDVLNAIIGLVIVPIYVQTSDLGALQPITAFGALLAVPVSVFATTFMKEITELAEAKRLGELKTLLKTVFAGVGIFLVIALVACRFLTPYFMKRMRIEGVSLSYVILGSAFVMSVAPIYLNALQGLKKFGAVAAISVICAPIRFLVMVLLIPFYSLFGYYYAQASAPASQIVLSIIALRKEWRVKAEPYWTRPVTQRFLRTLLGVASALIPFTLVTFVEQSVLRHCVSDIESAAYYVASRFSDIALFVTTSMLVTFFPYSVSRASEGRATRPLVLKASGMVALFGGVIALTFSFFGRAIFNLLPNCAEYARFAPIVPWMVGLAVFGAVSLFYMNGEISAGRFRFLRWWTGLHIVYAVGLESLATRASTTTTLTTLLLAFTAFAVVRLALVIRALVRQK